MMNVNKELFSLVDSYCEKLGINRKLTLNYLKAKMSANTYTTPLKYAKVVLDGLDNDTIEQLTIQKKYFDGIKFNGFDDDELNRTLLVLIENHCIKEFPITYEELDELNKQVASYCREKGYATYKQAVALILKSKLLKQCNIPLEMLQKQAQEQVDEWKQLIEDIQHGND